MTDPRKPELLGEVGNRRYLKAHYRYHEYEFEIERTRRWSWWCHSGIRIPIREREWFHSEHDVWEMVSICHEAGFASCSRPAILRKLCRAVDNHIRDELAAEQIRTATA